MASFKIYFSPDNIRRFRTNTLPSYDEFVSMLCKHYPTTYHPELRLQYVDSEGDKIDVTSQLEWNEMFDQLTDKNNIKINVIEVSNPKYFKDGPPPETLYFHNPLLNTRVTPDNASALSSSVSKCLEQFFPNGKILPFNIPTFLQNIVTIKYISGETNVDINVDIPSLGEAIYHKAMSYLDEKSFKEASHTFRAQCILQPTNAVAFYNVACAESLLGNPDEAIVFLNKSIDLGYRNIKHLLDDPDFNLINHTEGFRMACRRLEDLRNKENESLPIIPEPVKEPVPEPVKVPESQPVPQPLPEPVKEPVPEPVKVPEPQPVPQPPPEPVKEPVPEPVKVPEPLPVPQPPPLPVPESFPLPPYILTPWVAELEILHDIGYLNDEIIIPVLEKNRGNVQQTVLELLDM